MKRERDRQLFRELAARHPEHIMLHDDDANVAVLCEAIRAQRLLRFLFTGSQLSDAPFFH